MLSIEFSKELTMSRGLKFFNAHRFLCSQCKNYQTLGICDKGTRLLDHEIRLLKDAIKIAKTLKNQEAQKPIKFSEHVRDCANCVLGVDSKGGLLYDLCAIGLTHLRNEVEK